MSKPNLLEWAHAITGDAKQYGTVPGLEEVTNAEVHLARALLEIDKLHAKMFEKKTGSIQFCRQCVGPWPCPTRRILDGENDDVYSKIREENL